MYTFVGVGYSLLPGLGCIRGKALDMTARRSVCPVQPKTQCAAAKVDHDRAGLRLQVLGRAEVGARVVGARNRE